VSAKSKSAKKKKKKKNAKEAPVDEFIKHDVRKLNGVTLSAIVMNSSGDQVEASEYNPGGNLIVCLQVRSSFGWHFHLYSIMVRASWVNFSALSSHPCCHSLIELTPFPNAVFFILLFSMDGTGAEQ
jgi:hypothetical protein